MAYIVEVQNVLLLPRTTLGFPSTMVLVDLPTLVTFSSFTNPSGFFPLPLRAIIACLPAIFEYFPICTSPTSV